MQNWRQYAESVTALFVIADPIGAVPIFISLTTSQTQCERKRTAKIVAVTVAIVLVVSILQASHCWPFSELASRPSGSVVEF
jgi:multiple antibiotic resistance protein